MDLNLKKTATTDAETEQGLLDDLTDTYGEQPDLLLEDQEDGEERQMFQNKKANIALIVAGVVIVLGVVAAALYAFL